MKEWTAGASTIGGEKSSIEPKVKTPKVILGATFEEAKKGFFKEWDEFKKSPVTSSLAFVSDELFKDLVRLAVGIPLNPVYLRSASCLSSTTTSPCWYNKVEALLVEEMKKESSFLRGNSTIKTKRLSRLGRLSDDGSEVFFGGMSSAPLAIAETASKIRPEFYLLSSNEGYKILEELAERDEFVFSKLREIVKLSRCLG